MNQAMLDYHVKDSIDQDFKNPYEPDTIENMLYHKNWIDNIQWHLEDMIRDPSIDPVKGLKIKRDIDVWNQRRTDLVEDIDEFILGLSKGVQISPDATMNTETPAWAIDRF